MPKLFKVSLELHLEACDSAAAEAGAELLCFAATQTARAANTILDDKVTIFTTNGSAEVVTKAPKESYKKDKLIKVYGKDTAPWNKKILDYDATPKQVAESIRRFVAYKKL